MCITLDQEGFRWLILELLTFKREINITHDSYTAACLYHRAIGAKPFKCCEELIQPSKRAEFKSLVQVDNDWIVLSQPKHR